MDKNNMTNAIIVDADYVDKVVFSLIVNFERMLGRRIPQADLARWIDCIALDGGMRPQDSAQQAVMTQVVLLHDAGRQHLDNFVPASFADELDGKAFADNLGEFVISTPVVESITSKEQLLLDTLSLFCADDHTGRIMVVPSDEHYVSVRSLLRRQLSAMKPVTVFAMQPQTGGNFMQELLGYSLMAALGISSAEIESASVPSE